MYEIKASAASLNTEKSLIGRTVISFCINNLTILDQQIILTSCCTVRTGCKHLFVDLICTVVLSSFHGKCTSRTCLHTVSTGFTGTVCPHTFAISDHRLESTFQSSDRTSSYNLITGVDTSVAQDAQTWVIGKEFVGVINLSSALLSFIAGAIQSILICIVLKFTVSIARTGKAVNIVIRQKQIQCLPS